MTQPIDVSVPHKLGREEAKRRIAANIGSLQGHIPGGAAVTSNWVGDRLDLGINAMGQTVDASISVEDAQARVHVELGGMLGMLAAPIAAAIRAKAPDLLEDKRK
jgi:putative polyhydroxyalkanoate system protein